MAINGSQQNCPVVNTYSDEQILNRFEDSGLARTVSFPVLWPIS